MSDYDIVKQFVIQTGYKPTYRDLDGYIVSLLLHYESFVEYEESEGLEDVTSLNVWLDEFVKCDMDSYDYD